MLKSQSQLLRKSEVTDGAGYPHSSTAIALRYLQLHDPNKYYENLGLSPRATDKEIKDAFRREAKVYHQNGTDPDADVFDYIIQVYKVLIDPISRAEYNATPRGSVYLGQMEMHDLRNAMTPKEFSKIVEEVIDKPTYYMYHGLSTDKDLAQKWYELLISAAQALLLSTRIKLSVQDVEHPHVQSGIIIVPPWLTPNFFIALTLINRLKGRNKPPTGK